MGWLYQRRRRRGPSGGIVGVTDTFDRANSDLTLGTADSGQAWEPLGDSVWGIDTNEAKYVSGGTDNNIYAVIQSGLSDCTIEVTIPAVSGTIYLPFRCSDINNLFIVSVSEPLGVHELYSRDAGSFSLLDSDGTDPVAGQVVRVVLDGTGIEVLVDDVSLLTATSSFNQSATKHGLGLFQGNTFARWNDYTVTP